MQIHLHVGTIVSYYSYTLPLGEARPGSYKSGIPPFPPHFPRISPIEGVCINSMSSNYVY